MEISYRQEVYRKLIHLSSLWMPLLMFLAPRFFCIAVFGILLLGNIVVEYGSYRKWPFFHDVYTAFFGKMMREKEKVKGKFKLSGSPYVLGGAFLSILLFHREIAVIAMTTMLLGDTAAALIGRKYGKHTFKNKKSWEGTISFFITAYLVHFVLGLAFHLPVAFLAVSILSSLAATLVELYEKAIKVDDNLSIPLVVGFILSLYFI